MAYAYDLLQFAQEMANLHPEETHQPSLRRAISTGYYALFQLLISDAIANCTDPAFRATLARVFDHGSMKQASDRKTSELNDYFDQKPPEGPERSLKYHLYNVAEVFSQAQHNRNEADYNLLREWQPTQVSLLIEGIADAFNSWSLIREERERVLTLFRCFQAENVSRMRNRAPNHDPHRPITQSSPHPRNQLRNSFPPALPFV